MSDQLSPINAQTIAADLFADMMNMAPSDGSVPAVNDGPEPPQNQVPASDSEIEEMSAKITHRIYPKAFVGDDDFAVYAVEFDTANLHGSARLKAKYSGKITYAGHYRPEKGEKVVATGKWVTYKGESSFKAMIMVPEIPKGAEGAVTYLKIAKIEGVGKATIDKLVKKYGDRLPTVMEDADEMATTIKRILADRIAAAFTSMIGQPKLVTFLAEFGLREALIQKIIKRFGAASMKIVDENPWRLAEVIDGIGFNKSDMIGRKAGLDMRCEPRLKAGIRYTLNLKTNQQGHCGLTREYLIKASDEVLQVGMEYITPVIDAVIADRDAIFDEDVGLIYPAGLHKAERSLADRLLTIKAKGDITDEDKAREAVEAAILKLGVKRDESQVEAALMAVMNPVSIITGGPGTGKSTTQRIIVAALESLGKSVVLAAPTGRASKRLAEVTGKEASTCHRLLSFSAEKGDFLFDRSNPFPQNRFIVDEFSMIDVRLGSSFLDAIKDRAGLTIVGDVDQLPSVGAGQVLKDMIDSGAIPVARLRTIHRQSGDSGIVVAAQRINTGNLPIEQGEKLDGFYMKGGFSQFGAEDDIVMDVVDFMARRLPNSGFNPVDDIQVLASMKSGPTGVALLNERLKAALNPGTAENTVVFKSGGGELRYSVGDRIMHTRNDYVKKVYNGEVGIVVDNGMRQREDGKQEAYIKVDYSGHFAYYAQEDSGDITMAWASTVHKSQGCEFPVVIFVCPTAHRRMLNRNLFYTAVTRAKKVCIVIGHDGAVQHAVKTEDLDKRGTGLAKRLAA
ncbi:AAA family ATPase [Pararhizobium sp. BT-229]|uniref:SF1B family DNA helicase RecD2 n=1 Tax=Pararhizobium sp. BT-229 TaxID=2986923 RepID=UPI0021F7B8F4|nr:AAA family ATPase [Pararhizobium sp. BT-229]MCV9963557.1 AAA family ATPase [Pararhizobium sp. BT-229]